MISPHRTQDENAIPPLRDGDMLTIEEFERRWDAMPYLKNAELVEGRVYINSAPVRWYEHAQPHGLVLGIMSMYTVNIPGVESGVRPSVRMGPLNMPQPDGVLRIAEVVGGRTKIEDGFLVGSPEFIAEISDGTEKHDLGIKKELYLKSGVQEYFNWDVPRERITLFGWNDGRYVEIVPDESGILKSRVLPGLWFGLNQMIGDDSLGTLEVLKQGLQSSQHQEFLQEMEDRHAKTGGRS